MHGGVNVVRMVVLLSLHHTYVMKSTRKIASCDTHFYSNEIDLLLVPTTDHGHVMSQY